MKINLFKPLGWCAALSAGEIIAFSFSRFGACWPIFTIITTLVALIGFGWRLRGWIFFALFFLGVSLMFAISAARTAQLEESLLRTNEPVSMDVLLKDNVKIFSSENDTLCVSAIGKSGVLDYKVVFNIPENVSPPRRGELWRLTGWLSRNADFAGRHTLWANCERTSAARLNPTLESRFIFAIDALRENLLERTGIGIPNTSPSLQLNKAILLGERASLDEATRSDFMAAGTIHIFAISGIHVMFVARILLILLILLSLPLRIAGLILIPIVWLYAILTGFSPSTLRATLMITFYFSAPLFWRETNAILSWSLTFLLIHIFNPMQLFNLGSRLSFVVMLAIVLLLEVKPKKEEEDPIKKTLSSNFSITLTTWAAGVPIIAQAFGVFTPGGLLANPVVIPIAGFGVTAGVLGGLASYFSFSLAKTLNQFAALCTQAMSTISSIIARVPGSSITIAPWSFSMCLLWYLGAFLTLWFFYHERKRWW